MESRVAQTLLQLAGPRVGSEVRKVIRELSRLGGVRSVAPSAKIPRLLSIKYDTNVIQPKTLAHYVRRGWARAILV